MHLLNGDCLELMKGISDNSVDMVLCDLPYGTTACKWDIIIPFEELWNQYNRIIKDNGAIVLFSAQPFTTRLINSNLKNFKYCWYWKKNNVTGGIFCKYQPMRCIEDICVFYKKMPTYKYIKELSVTTTPLIKTTTQKIKSVDFKLNFGVKSKNIIYNITQLCYNEKRSVIPCD